MPKENIEIPKGNTPEAVMARDKIIKKSLSHLVDTTTPCSGLGNAPVLISASSVNETAHHAAKSYRSTCAALDIVHQIRTAKFHRMVLPKANKRQRNMGFAFLIEMHGQYDGKTTKLMIGARIKGDLVQYCITAQ